MKDRLDQKSRKDLIEYRLEKSQTSMQEAAVLAQGGFYDSAVTRLYYACYYAVSALLISHNIECGSHAGVKRMFSMHFGRDGKVDQQHIRTYSNLLQGRQISDYEDFTYQDSSSYAIYREEAEALLDAVKSLILV